MTAQCMPDLPSAGDLRSDTGLRVAQHLLDRARAEHGLSGLALVSSDGVSLAAALPGDMTQEDFAGLAAGMLAFSQRALQRIGGTTELHSVAIRYGAGRLYLRPLRGGELGLVILADLARDEQGLGEVASGILAHLQRDWATPA
ncbi:roadblock/LC7 domain-containing protein [Thermithiobacillus tepidarius DSM 3134]|uniref:roadblock/LC7 domain-containing protein n=1 Tax=Thermithiobacillus tepidarius TaxID=929 RepID=UPI0009DC1DD8|nr:roadblock/LC7 domain-containing protein [Thermithiobacillus tepidarius]